MSEIRIQEVQEGAQLMDKLVELLTVGTKWFSDKADAADLAILDKRINERAAEGWELVTYDPHHQRRHRFRLLDIKDAICEELNTISVFCLPSVTDSAKRRIPSFRHAESVP